MDDLVPGVALKGTVRNVVDFGAFVDIGVKHDGLLHRTRLPRGVTQGGGCGGRGGGAGGAGAGADCVGVGGGLMRYRRLATHEMVADEGAA